MLEPVEAKASKQKYFMQFLEGDFSLYFLLLLLGFCPFFVVSFLGPESEYWPNLSLWQNWRAFDRAQLHLQLLLLEISNWKWKQDFF